MTEIQETPLNSAMLLPHALTVSTVEALAADFLQQESSEPVVVLDAASVENITTPGVQLLLSLSVTLKEKGRTLRLRNARQTLSDTFEQLGLGAEFTALEE